MRTREEDPEIANYDSSDSYAGTFLSLAKTYQEITGDTAFIQENLDDLKLIATVMDATMRNYTGSDNETYQLSIAKANYDIAYMMDNTEVWRGYYDFGKLLEDIGDSDAQMYYDKANTVREAIEMVLWDEAQEGYKPHATGDLDWTVFYPDARANTRAITYDLPEAVARRSELWNKFMQYHGNAWINLTAGSNAVMPVSPAAIKAGAMSSVNEYFENVRDQIFPERAYPWTHTQSGFYLQSLLLLRDGYTPPSVPILRSQKIEEEEIVEKIILNPKEGEDGYLQPEGIKILPKLKLPEFKIPKDLNIGDIFRKTDEKKGGIKIKLPEIKLPGGEMNIKDIFSPSKSDDQGNSESRDNHPDTKKDYNIKLPEGEDYNPRPEGIKNISDVIKNFSPLNKVPELQKEVKEVKGTPKSSGGSSEVIEKTDSGIKLEAPTKDSSTKEMSAPAKVESTPTITPAPTPIKAAPMIKSVPVQIK